MNNEVFVIAEIGINHNGSLDITKKLIDAAVDAGCNAVKFQKRTLDTVYSKEELDRPRESPWGTTNRQQKEGLEFGKEEYDEINQYCKLLEAVAEEKKYTFISTGMSTMEQIRAATKIFENADCPYELMHCNSSYPMNPEDANLLMIRTLRREFGKRIGYSGHEVGIIVTCAAAAMGATSVERHITLDRSMYGSDQAASLEIGGLKRLVPYIREIEKSIGDGVKKVTDTEKNIASKLRKVDTL